MLEVDGDLRAMLADLQTLMPHRLAPKLNAAWAREGQIRLREYVGGGPVTRYLRMRSGRARDSVRAEVTPTGATLSVSGPGMALLETGGIIRAKRAKYLTFRLHQAWDGEEATGPWIRTKQVKLPARSMVRDAAGQALATLDGHLAELLGGDPR